MLVDKKLVQKWYRKLKSSGFKDIEDSENTLKVYDSELIARAFSFVGLGSRLGKINWFKAKRDYYFYGTQALNDYCFDSRIEKSMWRMHMNGISYRDIAEATGVYKEKVCKIINKIKKDLLDRLYREQKTHNSNLTYYIKSIDISPNL